MSLPTRFLLKGKTGVPVPTSEYERLQVNMSDYLYIIRCLLLKYRLIFFMSLESI